MLPRIFAILLLAALTTISAAAIQASRFDQNAAHLTVAYDPIIQTKRERGWGRWEPTPGSAPLTVETKIHRSAGAVLYTAMATPTLPSCFGPDYDKLDPRTPTEVIPAQFRPHMIVSWPVGDGTDPFLQSFSNAAVANEAFKSVLVSGWPMHALWCRPIRVNTGAAYLEPAIGDGLSFRVPTYGPPTAPPYRLIIIPLRPAWTGFLIDTTLFAAAWFSLLILPWQTRKHLRRRAGRCKHCAYDLTATPSEKPCPECGKLR
jgi:hypothetical protein